MKCSAHQLKLVLPPRFPYSLGSLMSPVGARVCQKVIVSIDDQVGRCLTGLLALGTPLAGLSALCSKIFTSGLLAS